MLATTIAIALCTPLGAIGLFLGPVLLAIGQSYVLKRERHRYLPWGIATLLSGYVALFLFLLLFLYGAFLTVPVMVFLCGATIGLAQGLVLKSNSRYWRWWPIVNGAILTVSIVWFIPSVLDASVYGSQRTLLSWFVLAPLTGLIGGCLKGLALAWFLKHPTLSRESP